MSRLFVLRVASVTNDMMRGRWRVGQYVHRYKRDFEDCHGPCSDYAVSTVDRPDLASVSQTREAVLALQRAVMDQTKGLGTEVVEYVQVNPLPDSDELSDDALDRGEQTRNPTVISMVEAYRKLRDHHVAETTRMRDRFNTYRSRVREAVKQLPDDPYAQIVRACRQSPGTCFCGAHSTETR